LSNILRDFHMREIERMFNYENRNRIINSERMIDYENPAYIEVIEDFIKKEDFENQVRRIRLDEELKRIAFDLRYILYPEKIEIEKQFLTKEEMEV